jgi:hypothetical protein
MKEKMLLPLTNYQGIRSKREKFPYVFTVHPWMTGIVVVK